MQQIIYILTLLISTCCFSQQEIQYGNVSLGRTGADCKGRGICSFTEVASKTQANAIIIYDFKENTATLQLFKNSISKDEQNALKAYKTTEKKLQPLEILSTLSIVTVPNKTRDIRLPNYVLSGKYPVSESNDYFIISVFTQ